MSYPSHFTRSLYWKTLQSSSCIHVFFKTAKILMWTHVKCQSCFYVYFSSSLFILRLKFIFKGTTDLVLCYNQYPPPFCCLPRSVKLAGFFLLYLMFSPFIMSISFFYSFEKQRLRCPFRTVCVSNVCHPLW